MTTEIQLISSFNEGKCSTKDSICNTISKEINHPDGVFLTRRAKTMTKDIENATDQIEKYLKNMTVQMDALIKKEDQLKAKTKAVSGQVRSATSDMADGIRKIEKTANFDKMSNYIALLERAASAFEKLAELETNGKLDKIIAAIK